MKTILGVEPFYIAPEGLTITGFCFYGGWCAIALSDGTVDYVKV